MEAVVGENRAEPWVLTRGSISLASSTEMRRSSTPFLAARSSRLSRTGTSASDWATTILPQRLMGRPRASQ